MEITTELQSVDSIKGRVHMIRGEQVMLDGDLAEIYGYDLKAMNQQVKRNIERFPDDFMFQLTCDEVAMMKAKLVSSYEKQGEDLKSQIVTSSWGGKRKSYWCFNKGRRKEMFWN
ncbi:MAG: ORF6N domain-containing protein [Lachnospiraceae bacterium]|nr:ORF6N domain-containing protein [Candidatus Merdinaster equi]